MIKLSATLFYIIMLIHPTLIYAETIKPPLIPLPERVEWLEGHFLLSEKVEIVSDSDDLTKYFIDRINILTGINPGAHREGNTGRKIVFRIGSLPETSDIEAYTLSVSENRVDIVGVDEEGIFRGMQTFFQLIPASAKAAKDYEEIEIPACEIFDRPVFKWRGLNLDCARHFMTKDFIKRYIDILAYYKFNVFHWHLTEDQGWRIEIKQYPKLTEIGAWRQEADGSIYGGYYTQEDIKEIVAYAQSRFITVVPEIEMPGHSLASLASYPENSCTGGPFEVATTWGVFKDVYCAGRDSTFYFLKNILDEVIDLFPGEYIHIGGDEVPKDRWQECPRCQQRIKDEGLKDEAELQSYFITRISKYLQSRGRSIIGWDEILEGGLAPGAIVQSWRGFEGAIEAARIGHYAISSPTSHTYLDYDPDDLDLQTAYSFNPIPDELTGDERKFIIGSEANMWTEHAPQETIDSKLFPRLLALSEVFWGNPSDRDYDEFHARVQKAYDDLTALEIQYGRESKLITYTTSFDEDNNEFIIEFSILQDDIDIRYTKNGLEPDETAPPYTEPIRVGNTSSLTFSAFRGDHFIGKKFTLSFDFHKALNAKLLLINPYDERYKAAGDNAIIDGVRGTDNFRDGAWQGYLGVDFEAVIDLGEEKNISEVIPRFYLNSTSWIFLPEKVTVAFSNDNERFDTKKVIVTDTEQKTSEIILKDYPFNFDTVRARYIKVTAKNMNEIPEWHPGAGSKAWLFIDEIVVR
jgi:hexosaminidase